MVTFYDPASPEAAPQERLGFWPTAGRVALVPVSVVIGLRSIPKAVRLRGLRRALLDFCRVTWAATGAAVVIWRAVRRG